MGKNFNLTALYAEGLKTKELRRLYAAQLSEKYDLREWDEYAEVNMYQAVKDALVSGDFLALGYSEEAEGQITAIPPYRWRFLDLDLYLGEARRSGAESLVFADIRCVPKDRLPNDLLTELSDPNRFEPPKATSDTRGSPLAFSTFGAGHWGEITLRFLKNDFVEIGGPSQKKKFSIERLGLMNRTQQIPNAAFELLIPCAKRRFPSTEKKHKISRLRKRLQEAFDTTSDPFYLQKNHYKPIFKVIDDRYAADERAKREASHVSYDDTKNYEPPQHLEEYTFDEENDETQDWLRENDH